MVSEINAIQGIPSLPERRRTVTLSEEDFVDSLEKIITRFYFPELLKIHEYKEWRKHKSMTTGVGVGKIQNLGGFSDILSISEVGTGLADGEDLDEGEK